MVYCCPQNDKLRDSSAILAGRQVLPIRCMQLAGAAVRARLKTSARVWSVSQLRGRLFSRSAAFLSSSSVILCKLRPMGSTVARGRPVLVAAALQGECGLHREVRESCPLQLPEPGRFLPAPPSSYLLSCPSAASGYICRKVILKFRLQQHHAHTLSDRRQRLHPPRLSRRGPALHQRRPAGERGVRLHHHSEAAYP